MAGTRQARSKLMAVAAVALFAGACSLTGTDPLPTDVTDPARSRTPEGALAAYAGVLTAFREAVGGRLGSGGRDDFDAAVPALSGLLTDELHTAEFGNDAVVAGKFIIPNVLDARSLPENTALRSDLAYANLHRVRALGSQAIGLLIAYIPDEPALAAHAYALEAYAEVMLAELFCSGIPLSTVDFNGDYTYRPGSPTRDVFAHAMALFDTAASLGRDSSRFVHLAEVGKGRALLGMGEFAAAAAAVAGVPDDYRYEVSFNAAPAARSFFYTDALIAPSWIYTVADREGGNGLDYRSSDDPRTHATAVMESEVGPLGPIFYPDKYDRVGATPIVLASGTEARLIEAEAALRADDAGTWLLKLNRLRETAITPALSDTTDPGTAVERVNLMFRERAFWLFLTGHRQGDLRRLIRQYGRTQAQVYPVGAYPGTAQPFQYGTDVTAPVPQAERVSNPQFTGCASRQA